MPPYEDTGSKLSLCGYLRVACHIMRVGPTTTSNICSEVPYIGKRFCGKSLLSALEKTHRTWIRRKEEWIYLQDRGGLKPVFFEALIHVSGHGVKLLNRKETAMWGLVYDEGALFIVNPTLRLFSSPDVALKEWAHEVEYIEDDRGVDRVNNCWRLSVFELEDCEWVEGNVVVDHVVLMREELFKDKYGEFLDE